MEFAPLTGRLAQPGVEGVGWGGGFGEGEGLLTLHDAKIHSYTFEHSNNGKGVAHALHRGARMSTKKRF